MRKEIEKLNTTLLKNMMKKDAGKKHENLLACTGDGWLYICIGGTRMHKIIKQDCFVNSDRIAKSESLIDLYNKLESSNKNESFFTGYSKEKDKIKYVEFSTRDGQKAFYNEKYIAEFGDLSDLILMVDGASNNKPAVVRNVTYHFEYIGVICPAIV